MMKLKDNLNIHNMKHPHGYGDTSRYSNNTIYIGSNNLTVGDKQADLKGYGLFKNSVSDLILTSPQCTRSMWKLPKEYFKDSLDETFINRIG